MVNILSPYNVQELKLLWSRSLSPNNEGWSYRSLGNVVIHRIDSFGVDFMDRTPCQLTQLIRFYVPSCKRKRFRTISLYTQISHYKHKGFDITSMYVESSVVGSGKLIHLSERVFLSMFVWVRHF